MGFTYEEQKLSLNYKGNDYEFREPTALEQQNIGNAFKASTDETNVVAIYISFFIDLGIPAEVINKMSMKGLMDLFSYAVGAKKN